VDLVCWAFAWRALGNNSSGLSSPVDSIDKMNNDQRSELIARGQTGERFLTLYKAISKSGSPLWRLMNLAARIWVDGCNRRV
jgi:hypothetical protein